MDGTRLQGKIYSGLAKAAKRIGFPCDVYRSVTLLTPLASGNKIVTGLYASFTTGYAYAQYNKPHVPFWTALLNGAQIQIGDWIVGTEGTFFIADLQATLPIPAIQCNRVVSIRRPSYSSSGPMEQSETSIAASLPVFAYSARAGAKVVAGFPIATDGSTGLPSMTFYINARGVGDIQKNDVIVDENNLRYVIETPNPTSFGFIVEARLEKP